MNKKETFTEFEKVSILQQFSIIQIITVMGYLIAFTIAVIFIHPIFSLVLLIIYGFVLHKAKKRSQELVIKLWGNKK